MDTLIAAAGLGGFRVDVAGEGPARAELERLAAEAAPGLVTFHGRLAKDDLHDLMRRARVAAAPSRWHENQPMAVLEAFACGLPVVTTGLGGLPELVEPGVDGAIVPADDPAALAAALAPLAADPERAFTMGKAGRAKVERDFAPDVHISRLRDVYSGVPA
ncbi:glycosyltransferase family 4 protein [Phytohabitans flavus]|uniref:glycosyltransferase family 4 protein n=1 Tax=Phytohabitans flavus TaxID=1076124 RepID=UPI00362EAA6B